MNLLMTADAAAATTTTSGTGSILLTFVPLILTAVLFYFLLIAPQRKEAKKVKAMLAAMEVGDFVVTTGGFYGVIIDITDEDVIVEFGNNKNCRIPMKKSAIAQVEKAGQN